MLQEVQKSDKEFCFAAATYLSSGKQNTNSTLRLAAQPKISSIRAR